MEKYEVLNSFFFFFFFLFKLILKNYSADFEFFTKPKTTFYFILAEGSEIEVKTKTKFLNKVYLYI